MRAPARFPPSFTQLVQPKTGRRAAQYRALGGLAGLFCVAGVDRGRKSAIPLRPAPHSRGGGDLTAAEPSLRSLNPEPLETGVGPLLRLPDRRGVRWRGLGRRRPSEQRRTGARSAGPGGGQWRCAARAPASRKASVPEKLLHRALSGPTPTPTTVGRATVQECQRVRACQPVYRGACPRHHARGHRDPHIDGC